MSKQYIRITQKNQLESEIKAAKNALVKEKARCFKILNDSAPFVPKCGKEAQKTLEEFENLCNYYGIDPKSFKLENQQVPEKNTSKSPSTKKTTAKNSPGKVSPKKSVPPKENNEDEKNHFSIAFESRMNELIQEEKAKKALLDRLNKKLLLVRKQNDSLANEKHTKMVSIDKSFKKLKEQIKEIHDNFSNFTIDIKTKINASKQRVINLINDKKNKSQASIDKLDSILDQLQNNKNSIINTKNDLISRLSSQLIQDFHYEYKDDKLKEIISRAAAEVLKRFDERLKSGRFNQLNDEISQKINNLNSRIGLLIQKINKCREERAKRVSAAMCHNWAIMTQYLMKSGSYQQALDEYICELQAEDDEITKQLNAELEIVNRKVPGTNLTILELRKEIVELTAKLSNLTITKTDQLKNLQREHEELRDSSQKTIEELEKQLDA